MLESPYLEIKKNTLDHINDQIKKSPLYIYISIRIFAFIFWGLVNLIYCISLKKITLKFLIPFIKKHKVPFFSDLVLLFESLIILRIISEEKI